MYVNVYARNMFQLKTLGHQAAQFVKAILLFG